jgi:hypothetical protein
MKRRFFFLWVVFVTLVTFCGCSPASQTTQTPVSALVKVECHNAPVRQILELLRSGRARDISVAADGSSITAAFNPADLTPGKLEQIMQELNDLEGVLHVEVMENPHPILNDVRFAPRPL